MLLLAALAPLPAQAGMETVTVGANGFLSDAALYIAQRKGYFSKQGLNVKLIQMSGGGLMTVPLATGDLDVGGGSLSAGLYNSALRGIYTRIVADKSRPTKFSTSLQLILRKALQGKVKTTADLKGLRIGMNGTWGAPASSLNEILKAGGLKFSDVQVVWNLSNSQQIVALANGGIDGSMNADTGPLEAVKQGVAMSFIAASEVYPNQQSSALFYSEKFIRARRDVAVKFMIAYLQGSRFFSDGLVNGRLAGPIGEEVIDILAKETVVKDKQLLAQLRPNGSDPDGQVNAQSMNKDITFFREHRAITGDITAESVIDASFAKQAIAVIGPYKRKQ